jgi:AraC family transcriptional regulator
MIMFLRIEKIEKKKLIGKSIKMSLADNNTFELWQSFMMKREAIKNRVDSNYISMQVYDYSKGNDIFNPDTEYEKRAVVEVSDLGHIPEGMHGYEFNGGLYAVFLHKGHPGLFLKTYKYIFEEWFPGSEYELDEREHYELLGDKYKNSDPASEEEVYLPVRRK